MSAVRSSIPAEDAFLTRAAACGRGIRILRQDPWEMLITFIISQRKNMPAIRLCVEKLCLRYGTLILNLEEKEADTSLAPELAALKREEPSSPVLPPHDSDREMYAFPTQDQLADASEGELRSLGLGYRAPYIIDAVQIVQTGIISLKELQNQSLEEAIANLEKIRGVGAKVASCVCLFGLGMTAPVPVDVWIRRVMEQKYGGRNPWQAYGENAGSFPPSHVKESPEAFLHLPSL